MRRGIAVIGVLIAISGCGPQGSNAATQARTTASEARTNPPYTASGARTLPPPTPNTTGLSCTLPVVVSDRYDPANYRYRPARGGFMHFPSGVVTEDPAGGMQSAGASSARINTVAKPTLPGYGGLSYDSPAKRWVPTSQWLVSPDGSSYVYSEPTEQPAGVHTPTRIHVVTVLTGADRVVYSRGATDYPIEFGLAGIYLVTGRWEASSVGLRLLDPLTGAIRVLAITGEWSVISAGAAWGIDADLGGIGNDPHRIDRLDLTTGAVTTWFEVASDRWVAPVGIDVDGALIIASATSGTADTPYVEDFYRLLGRSQTVHLFTAGSDEALDGFITDSHGLWFGSAYVYGGLWLYKDGAGLRLVADNQNRPVRVESAAGPCT
jgi:hypothetical protein